MFFWSWRRFSRFLAWEDSGNEDSDFWRFAERVRFSGNRNLSFDFSLIPREILSGRDSFRWILVDLKCFVIFRVSWFLFVFIRFSSCFLMFVRVCSYFPKIFEDLNLRPECLQNSVKFTPFHHPDSGQPFFRNITKFPLQKNFWATSFFETARMKELFLKQGSSSFAVSKKDCWKNPQKCFDSQSIIKYW